ncbi:MAG: KamA family radical SAM protein, partial [Polyangia bacterium]|nr:KamA family radical SAM protein [Polyangia bacterium]
METQGQARTPIQVEFRELEEEPPGCTASEADVALSLPEPALAPPGLLDLSGRARRTPRNPRTRAFRRRFYPTVSDHDWNDWHWQLRNRVTQLAELERFLQLSPDEIAALAGKAGSLPASITPYYLSLLDPADSSQPLRRTAIPSLAECARSPGEADDPLGEEGHSVVPGLVHRYPDRVLLLVHDRCAMYCRYCTRSRMVGHGELRPDMDRLAQAVEYIRQTPAVRDVLLSGGDPLLLPDEALAWILGQLRSIPHVEVVRIGTKVPAVLPQRITQPLVRILRRYHPLWMSL